MKLEDIKKAAVIGAGNMGSGIAEVLSRLGGYQVMMSDSTKELVERGSKNQRNMLKILRGQGEDDHRRDGGDTRQNQNYHL